MKQVAHLPAQQGKGLIVSLLLVLFGTISGSRVALEQGIRGSDAYAKNDDRIENSLLLPMTEIQNNDEIQPEGHVESRSNNFKGNHRFISLSRGRSLTKYVVNNC